jgi:(R,R)-butanediol dehydrogenase/meso-butanediol dehydrogenase/diacetyl reductase
MEFYPGAYAEYCLGWADLLHPISPKVSFAEAAMADIVCVAVHAFGRTAIYEGSNIFCIGGGPLGLGIAIVAKASGAGEVFVSDPSPIARNVISQYPDLTPLDPTEVDVKRFITENVSHPQCAAIFDSVGTEETMKLAIPLLEEGGTYVNLAIHSAPLNIDALCLGSERTISTSSNAFYSDLEKSFEMLNSGVIDVLPWITHRFPLEGFADAFEKLLSSPKMGYKVVFEPFKDSYRREDRR